MELDYVPTRRQVLAARLVVKISTLDKIPVEDDIQAVADWPLEKAAIEPEPKAS